MMLNILGIGKPAGQEKQENFPACPENSLF